MGYAIYNGCWLIQTTDKYWIFLAYQVYAREKENMIHILNGIFLHCEEKWNDINKECAKKVTQTQKNTEHVLSCNM